MFQKIKSKIISLLPVILLSTLLVVLIIYAWTEPTQPPPAGNVPAPLNVGPIGQIKQGGLILNTGGAPLGLIVDQGKVGIGTTEPTAKLEVVGDIKLSGNLIVKDSSNNFDSLFSGGIIKEKFLPYCKQEITSDVYTNTQNQSTGCNFGGYLGYYNIDNLIPENVKKGVPFGRGQVGTYEAQAVTAAWPESCPEDFKEKGAKVGDIYICNLEKLDCCVKVWPEGERIPEELHQCSVCTGYFWYLGWWGGLGSTCVCGITYRAIASKGNYFLSDRRVISCSIGYWGGSYCHGGAGAGWAPSGCVACQVK